MDPCRISRVKASVYCIDTRCTSGAVAKQSGCWTVDMSSLLVERYLRLEQLWLVPRPLLVLSALRSSMYGLQDLFIISVFLSICQGLHAPVSSPSILRFPPPYIVLRWRAPHVNPLSSSLLDFSITSRHYSASQADFPIEMRSHRVTVSRTVGLDCTLRVWRT